MTAAPKPTSRKKLIEVSIPLEAINAETKRRKQKAPKGYPTSFHKYWAQRPVAACRAVVFSQLVDDPSSCPEEFPTFEAQKVERDRLHRLIERMIRWEASTDEAILSETRYEIARSVARERGEILTPLDQMRPQQIVDYLQKHVPPIYDPFSGAASIPLEAQRLGLVAIGTDLNPLAVLIGKALVEFPPKFADRKPLNSNVNELHQWKGAQGLADDLRYYARWMREEAVAKIGHFYPKVALGDGESEATAIAWFWTRTVQSPDPRAQGVHVPLVSSFIVSAKSGKFVIVRPIVDRTNLTWRFEIDEQPIRADIETAKKGTKAARGANFTCLLTGAAIDDTHVKSEAAAGRMGARLMAIVAEGNRRRLYVAPTDQHEYTARSVMRPEVPELEQPVPERLTGGTCRGYGLDRFDKLYAPRQLLALTTFSDLVSSAREQALADAKIHWSGEHGDDTCCLAEGGLGPTAYADTIAVLLSIVLSRMALYGSSL